MFEILKGRHWAWTVSLTRTDVKFFMTDVARVIESFGKIILVFSFPDQIEKAE